MKNSGVNDKDKDLFIRRWMPKGKPVGILQIIHGMGEHSERYHDLAEFLNSAGYMVVAGDHRGHGYSVSHISELGDITPPFETLVEDQTAITRELRREFPILPLFIMGHSMGSFIAQGHMKSTSSGISGYILSGSAKVPSLKPLMGSVLGSFITAIGGNKRSRLMNKLLFAGYNNKIAVRETAYDWLSRDAGIVRRYISDPYCGFVYTSAFYTSFLRYLSRLFDKDTFRSIPKNLPVHILSGDMDPVGFYGKGVKDLYDFYLELGFEGATLKLYPQSRHEIINEINKDEVYTYILSLLEDRERQ